jgi:hypothetical protein
VTVNKLASVCRLQFVEVAVGLPIYTILAEPCARITEAHDVTYLAGRCLASNAQSSAPPYDHVVGLLQVAQHVRGYQPSLNVIRMLEPLPAIVVEGEREAEQHLLVRGVRKA